MLYTEAAQITNG